MENSISKNEKQKICLNLINEIDSICAANKIDYYFIGGMAISMYRDDEIITNGTIGIHAKDVKKFISAVGNNLDGSRALETPFDSPNLPALFLRYCDLNTLDCSLNSYKSYLYNCLHINIKIITGMPKGGLKNKIKRKIAAFYLTSNVTSTTGKSVKYKLVRKGIRFIRHIFGWKNTSKIAFNCFLSVSSDKSAKVKIDKKKYDRTVFGEPYEKFIGGFRYCLPTKVEKYLSDTYGKWKKKTVSDDKPSTTRAISANMSWKEFQRRMKECNFDQYYVELKKYKRENRKFSIYNKKVNGYYYLLERTNDRFLLYTEYKDKKKDIQQLFENESYSELKDILRPFISALEKNYKRGLGLCFDKEIFNITMGLYELDGKKKKADEMRALVPNEHWEPIRLKNYKGEYIN